MPKATCYRDDPTCGAPNAQGVPTFCGEACWRAAGRPGQSADGLALDEDDAQSYARPRPRDVKRLASDPKIQDAIRRLAPKKSSGIDSVTISFGGQTVTLTPEDRARMDAARRKGRS